MKRILPALLAVITVGFFFVVSFFFKLEPGLKPVLLPPSENIVETINSTNMPLKLPAGYSAEIFAKDLGTARVLVADPDGTILVSSPDRGAIYALRDGKRITVVDKLNKPHGFAFKCDSSSCTLFVAENNALDSFDYDANTNLATNKKKLVDLPSSPEHITRSLLVNPANENQLLVSIGSTCNVCRESDPKRAAIWVYDLSNQSFTAFATGLRNSVFMTVDPGTKDIWATEMGRDNLGDDIPPDEINVIGQGMNYGWPNCYGQNIHDTQFDKNTYIRNPCMQPFEQPAQIDLQAHSAPLGLAFLEAKKTLLVAYHGSWNRTVPTGYKIVKITLDANGKQKSIEDFISGWLTAKNTAIGRPVGILVQGRNIFVSDDKAGVVYKFSN